MGFEPDWKVTTLKLLSLPAAHGIRDACALRLFINPARSPPMIRTLYLLLSHLCVCVPEILANDEWVWQNPIPQGNRLMDVDFVDPSTGTAVGLLGTIIHTTNGGETWTPQSSGARRLLTGVSFADAGNGIITSGSVVLRTADGGESWISQVAGTTESLRGVSFTDVGSITVVGRNGTILRTGSSD
jgi:photosystem II stability/assembly factor-like uncharacterized protein